MRALSRKLGNGSPQNPQLNFCDIRAEKTPPVSGSPGDPEPTNFPRFAPQFSAKSDLKNDPRFGVGFRPQNGGRFCALLGRQATPILGSPGDPRYYSTVVRVARRPQNWGRLATQHGAKTTPILGSESDPEMGVVFRIRFSRKLRREFWETTYQNCGTRICTRRPLFDRPPPPFVIALDRSRALQRRGWSQLDELYELVG